MKTLGILLLVFSGLLIFPSLQAQSISDSAPFQYLTCCKPACKKAVDLEECKKIQKACSAAAQTQAVNWTNPACPPACCKKVKNGERCGTMKMANTEGQENPVEQKKPLASIPAPVLVSAKNR